LAIKEAVLQGFQQGLTNHKSMLSLAIKMAVLQWVPFWVPFGLDKSLSCVIVDSMFGTTISMGVIKTPPDRLV
jgi:hypothetical protein